MGLVGVWVSLAGQGVQARGVADDPMRTKSLGAGQRQIGHSAYISAHQVSDPAAEYNGCGSARAQLLDYQ